MCFSIRYVLLLWAELTVCTPTQNDYCMHGYKFFLPFRFAQLPQNTMMAAPVLNIVVIVVVIINSSPVISGNESVTRLLSKLDTLQVVDLQNGCGRQMKNRIIVFSDGSRAYCKYSENTIQQQGELYTYHLSQILFNNNNNTLIVPPIVLVTLNLNDPLWRNVAAKARNAGWRNGKRVLLTLFIEYMQEEYFPANVLAHLSQQANKSTQLPLSQRDTIPVTWSDLIVFDYISGNSDRLYCSLVNSQWAPNIIHKPIHNLGKISSSSLILYDNESCFTIGYSINKQYSQQLQSYYIQHLCEYNQDTIDKLQQHLNGKRDLLIETEKHLIRYNNEGFLHVKQLSRRIRDEFTNRTKLVIKQFDNCQL